MSSILRILQAVKCKCVLFFRKTPEIDPDILKNMTVRQFVGYAPNPKKGRRNQVFCS